MNESKPTTNAILDRFLTTEDLNKVELALNDLADYGDITHKRARELLSTIKKLNQNALVKDELLDAFINS